MLSQHNKSIVPYYYYNKIELCNNLFYEFYAFLNNNYEDEQLDSQILKTM